MEKQIFKETGVGSLAWYLQTIKNSPDRKGFSYLRKGTPLQFDAVKTAVEYLVGARYLNKNSKPDQPRNDSYTVTSFGHRYLEQHKSDLEGSDLPAPVERESEETPPTEEMREQYKERHPEIEKVSDLLGKPFHPGKAPEFVPSVPETPEQRKKIMGLDLRRGKNLLPGGEPMGSRDEDGPDTAFDDIRTPKVRAVAEAMPEPTAEAQPGDGYAPEADGPAVEDRGDSADLVTTLKQNLSVVELMQKKCLTALLLVVNSLVKTIICMKKTN